MRRKDPFADVQPAEYALPAGVPALQEDPVRTRRWFMAIGVGAFALGGAGGWAVRGWSASAAASRTDLTPQLQKQIEWARRKAVAPIAELIDARVGFLPTLKYCFPDDPAWHGLERLLEVVVAGTHADVDVLRSHILELAPTYSPPASIGERIAQLRRKRR